MITEAAIVLCGFIWATVVWGFLTEPTFEGWCYASHDPSTCMSSGASSSKSLPLLLAPPIPALLRSLNPPGQLSVSSGAVYSVCDSTLYSLFCAHVAWTACLRTVVRRGVIRIAPTLLSLLTIVVLCCILNCHCCHNCYTHYPWSVKSLPFNNSLSFSFR